MNEARSVRISVNLRNQLKVIARKLSSTEKQPDQHLKRVTIVGLLEEGIDELFRVQLEELVRWAKEGQRLVIAGEESIPIRIDAERADKIGLLAATIQKESNVPILINDLTEEAGRRIINRVELEESDGLVSDLIDLKGTGKERRTMKAEEALTPSFIVLKVYNRKGGVGKTSVAGNLATILAALGFNVGLGDGDDQENVTKLDTRKKWRATLSNVLTGTTIGNTSHPPVPLLGAMVQIRKRLWLIPADKALGSANDTIGKKGPNEGGHDVLIDRIEELRNALQPPPPWEGRFPWWRKPKVDISAFRLEETTDEEYFVPPASLDFFIWDSPPAANHLTDAMMLSSDQILVPVEMDQFSADGLQQVLDGIKALFRRRSHKAEIVGILPNKILHQSNDVLTMDFLESVFRYFPEYARRPIHYDPYIKNAWAYGQAALEYNRDSRGVRELCSLALELVGYEGDMAGVPLCEICNAAAARAQQEKEGIEV